MDFGIAGRVAFVVGGSKGIGLESARMLAAEGCRVAIVARGQKHIDLAVDGIRADGGEAIGVIADMTQRDQIERAVAETTAAYGPPEIVITQADFHVRGFFEEIEDDEAFVDSYRAYTMSQVYVMRAVIPAMKEAGWGRYVHIGSGTAKEPVSKPPHTIANGTRPSTVGLLKSLADEYAQFGITINTVAPGWIATKTTNWYLSTHEGLTTEEQRREWLIKEAGVPAGRAGEPAEIASTVVYLCSELAGYVNGHYIAVDGAHHRSAF